MKNRLLSFLTQTGYTVLSVAWSWYLFPLRLFKKGLWSLGTSPPIERILIAPRSAIGDFLLFTPALRAVRTALPDAHLTLLVEPRGARNVISGSEWVDQIVEFDFSRSRWIRDLLDREKLRLPGHYDLAICCTFPSALVAFKNRISHRVGFRRHLWYHERSSFLLTQAVLVDPNKHEVEQYRNLVQSLGIEVVDTETCFHLSEEDRVSAEKFLVSDGLMPAPPVVGFHAGSYRDLTEKQWPRSKFAELADLLVDRYNAAIVIVGGPDERESADALVRLMRNGERAINVAGRTTLKQTAALIERCDLFVSNDSGPMHIAVAVKTPIVAIFGPTSPARNGPWAGPSMAAVVRKELPCSPCFEPHDARVECTNMQKFECLTSITAREVFRVIEERFGTRLQEKGEG